MSPTKQTSSQRPWHTHITIDLLVHATQLTILHPFVAWMLPLSLLAQATPYTHLSFKVSVAYAAFLTLLSLLSIVNKRIAYGAPRKVDFADEVIVITGGASGLGLVLAEVYGMRGCSVAVLDLKEMEGAEGRGVKWYSCDVSDEGQVRAAAKQIEQDLGPPTILINNAALAPIAPLLSLPSSSTDRVLAVNLHAHFHTLRTFLPSMLARPQGGTVVTIASVLGHLGCASLAAYTASKAGLLALHASLRAELRTVYADRPGARNVRIVLVTPGQLGTQLFDRITPPSHFFGPTVEVSELAREIVAMVDRGESGVVAMPLYARWIEWLSVLPVGVQELVRRWAGLDWAAVEGFGAVKEDDNGDVR